MRQQEKMICNIIICMACFQGCWSACDGNEFSLTFAFILPEGSHQEVCHLLNYWLPDEHSMPGSRWELSVTYAGSMRSSRRS